LPLPVIHIFFTSSTPHFFHYYTIGISYQIAIAIHLFNTIFCHFSIQRDVVQILCYLQSQPVHWINNYFCQYVSKTTKTKILSLWSQSHWKFIVPVFSLVSGLSSESEGHLCYGLVFVFLLNKYVFNIKPFKQSNSSE
jgi:hypothetical protein